MKRTTLAALAALVLVGVTACGTDAAEPEDGPEYGDAEVFTVDVQGRDVTCVAWDTAYGGGLSCDWHGAS